MHGVRVGSSDAHIMCPTALCPACTSLRSVLGIVSLAIQFQLILWHQAPALETCG